MELHLLGPVEAIADSGDVVDIGGPQRRAVLAALAVDAGRLVTRETLIDRVWDQRPPASVHAAVYGHVAHLRRLLDQPSRAARYVQRQPGGYVLRVEPDLVDLHRFRRLMTAAQETSDVERAAVLRQALALWRGHPLAGVTGDWAARMRQGWLAARLDAVVAWADAELALGNPGRVVGALTDLTGEHPLHEALTGALMRALAAAGRASDALVRYTAIRQRLADELGADPGGDLQALYHTTLRGQPAQPRP
ncbi:MAG: AfsR/SARP family transcriptional regulator, partial [Dactylosporangium sp.]|nr:AfsR/SARP family transcriptional regulator [Dactylosporangium sp.]NNJ62834.1 AfsR/SARP family transcriptional regulator [Dactylosporangium sp.]